MKKLFWLSMALLLSTLAACGGAPTPTIDAVSVTTIPSLSSGSSGLVAVEVNGTGAFSSVVTWTSSAGLLSKTTGSVITFTAPVVSSATDVTITATSKANVTKFGSVVISVKPIPIISSVTEVIASSDIATVNAASQAVLNAVVSGTNGFSNAVHWSIVSGNGTLSAVTGSSITFTAPSLPVSSTTIIRATSVQDPGQSSVVTLNINPTEPNSSITGVTLIANPNTTLAAKDTADLTATVDGTGAFGNGVTWNIVSGGGTISAATGSSITFTAPSLTASSTTIVRATSVQDPSKFAIVNLSINPTEPNPVITSVTVSANPNIILEPFDTTVLSAVVVGTGAFETSIIWSIVSGAGTISAASGSSITFTAPSLVANSITIIRASSVEDPSKSDTISLSIKASGVTDVSISTTLVNLREGGSSVLQGIVSGIGSIDPTLIWTIENGVGSLSSNNGSLSSSIGSTVSYTAPTSSFGKVVRITATSLQDPSKTKTIFLGVHPNKQSISAGIAHSLALKSDGTILAWGADGNGQLGDGGANLSQESPVPVSNATGIVAVSAGGSHSLALKSDGTILAWGNDGNGQLGDGGTIANTSQISPVPVSNTTGVVAVSAGSNFSLALKSDGTILAWGSDDKGQLGNGTNSTNQASPVPVSNATGIVAVSAGGSHSLALKSNGTILAWGDDGNGQLGDGGTNNTNQTSPVSVLDATGIVAVSAGGSHSLALKSDGTILAWGNDDNGQLGNGGSNLSQTSPVPVSNAIDVVAVSASAFHSLALKSNGTILAWGSDDSGQLGDGGANTNQAIPVPILSAIGIVAVGAGNNHSLALKSDGTMLSWGRGTAGQLGNNAIVNQSAPVSVSLGAGITIRLP